MALDIGLLMAGAKERGELEARVTGLISEVKKAGYYRNFFFWSCLTIHYFSCQF